MVWFHVTNCKGPVLATLTNIQILLASFTLSTTSLDLDPTCFITIIEITPQIIGGYKECKLETWLSFSHENYEQSDLTDYFLMTQLDR